MDEKQEYINNLMKLNPWMTQAQATKDWDNYQAHLKWVDERVSAGLPVGREYDGVDDSLDRLNYGYAR